MIGINQMPVNAAILVLLDDTSDAALAAGAGAVIVNADGTGTEEAGKAAAEAGAAAAVAAGGNAHDVALAAGTRTY